MEQEHDTAETEAQSETRSVIVRVVNVCKTYSIPNGRLEILKEINFQVQQGEFIAITGSSGSGKTTLLSLLGALDSPDSGEIWLDTTGVHGLKGVTAADFRRQKIGFVFQLFYLLPNLTALENVMAPLLPYRRKLAFDLKQRAQDLLESVGLGDRLGHTPARLSGGEQQRVAIARALATDPAFVIADEPTGNLDAKNGENILKLVSDLRDRTDKTFIIATHDPEVACHANRAIRIVDGLIASIDNTDGRITR